MAASDYRLCDVCGSKAFYDVSLNYDFDSVDVLGNPKLQYVSSMAVVCDKCADTHVAVVIERPATQEGGDKEGEIK